MTTREASAAPYDVQATRTPSGGTLVKFLVPRTAGPAPHDFAELEKIRQIFEEAAVAFAEALREEDAAVDFDRFEPSDDLRKMLADRARRQHVKKALRQRVEKALDGALARQENPMTESNTRFNKLLVGETGTADTKTVLEELNVRKRELADVRATTAALIRTQADQLATLTKRLETLEAQPMPGGPVRNAHALGARDASAAPAATTGTIEALQTVARETADPAVKHAIATAIVKLQRRSG